MVSFSTWYKFYRIPLIRKNKEAIRILRDLFYVLVVLNRLSKMQEFLHLRYLYFKMIDSFAQYGRTEAQDTVAQLLDIPWFRDNQRDLYRLLAAYNNVSQSMAASETHSRSKFSQERLNRDADNFFEAYKSLLDFDERDEKRIDRLLQNRDLLDEIVRNLIDTLDNSSFRIQDSFVGYVDPGATGEI